MARQEPAPLDSRQLRVFHEVVATGSYSGAARALGFSQPAVSQQMRALERHLGTPLFTRVGRAQRLTEAGRLLAARSAPLLEGLAATARQVAAVRNLAEGHVRVCAFPSASATIVASAVASLRSAHPGIRVQLVEAEPPDSLAMLRAGDCDITLAFHYPGAPEPDSGDFVATPLLEEPLEVVLPEGHPAGEAEGLSLPDLSRETWIAGCARCRAQFVTACDEAGFAPDIAFATDDALAVQSLVVAGVGIAVLPRLGLSFLRHPRLRTRPLRPIPPRSVMAYTWPEHGAIPATARVLAELRAVSRAHTHP